ncbi:hypothetical protein NA57DRAFT_79027 [Rhizodiscina lignyota]|uniref:Uncharacterized protein n=1 Tax=Rhizodiscina lignyota TaxID=1504668 RepID=A0A9P4I768_9PEZI|nr:hypothetical protein NA57DRAFT_79027 [Rhizodiscina lignyota]
MANSTETLAVQRALLMPEVLSAIFKWIHEDNASFWYAKDGHRDTHYRYGREGVLVRCGLVNRLWFKEAMRCLWMEPNVGFFRQCNLPALFAKINPSRRQFYADFIKKAVLVTISDSRDPDSPLCAVIFPKLEALKLVLDGYCDGFYVPKVNCPKLTNLEIDPPYESEPEESFGITRDEMDIILDQIPNVFPSLEYISFLNCVKINSGALKHLAERLPHFKDLDESEVRTSTEDDSDG